MHEFWTAPAGRALERYSMGERQARAVWSVIAEAHDPVARLLWLAVGPEAALELAVDGDLQRIAALVESAAVSEHGSELSVAAARQPRRLTDIAQTVRRARDAWMARMGPETWHILEASHDAGVAFVLPGDSAWPAGMSDLRVNAPSALWMRGAVPDALDDVGRAAAIVGCRAATPYGNDVAREISYALADRGVTVVSGGAFGVDASAHEGALAHHARLPEGRVARDVGPTVAFLAGGLDAYYPVRNAPLLTRVSNHGAVYSEAAVGTTPTRWRFLSRNRLIAASAGATVVVEAAFRSGALSTAAHADALSRPVGAVPGPIHSAASAGCHVLVAERGAALVTGVEDVLALLSLSGDGPGPAPGEQLVGSPALMSTADVLDSADRLVFDGIPAHSRIREDALAKECSLPASEVVSSLARLELLGLVTRTGQYTKRAA